MLSEFTGLEYVLSSLVVLYSLFAFFLSLYRPKIGLYMSIPIIGLGFEDTAVIKGGFIAIIFLAAFINALAVRRKFILSKEVALILIILLLFAVWVLARALLTAQDMDYWIEWVVKRLFVPGVLAFLTVYILREEKDLKTFSYTLIGFALVTAFFGIMQYFFTDGFFWKAREILGVPASIAYQIFDRVRVTGLSSYVIPLSYQLTSIIPLAIALFILKRDSKYRFLKLLSLAVLIGCLLLTFIKAGIGGTFIGSLFVFVLGYRSKLLRSWAPLSIILAVTLIFSVTVYNGELDKNLYSLGESSYERIPIALAAVSVVMNNPLGVGYAYNDHVREVYSEISEFLGADIALRQFPHNIILNLGTILGLPALLIAIMFYFLLFKNLSRASRDGGYYQILAIGLMGSFVAYIINAMFHNNSPFFGDTFNWLIIGLALAAINRVALSRKGILLE